MNDGVKCLGGVYWRLKVNDQSPIDHIRPEVCTQLITQVDYVSGNQCGCVMYQSAVHNPLNLIFLQTCPSANTFICAIKVCAFSLTSLMDPKVIFCHGHIFSN